MNRNILRELLAVNDEIKRKNPYQEHEERAGIVIAYGEMRAAEMVADGGWFPRDEE